LNQDIEEVFKGLGENQLMDIIENKLHRYEAKEEIIMQVTIKRNNLMEQVVFVD